MRQVGVRQDGGCVWGRRKFLARGTGVTKMNKAKHNLREQKPHVGMREMAKEAEHVKVGEVWRTQKRATQATRPLALGLGKDVFIVFFRLF